ncbi:MAG: polyketide synthase family protein, partial [Mycobacterium sp.]|nr:polyketide synthase family protein [Mycobacterium sp.]
SVKTNIGHLEAGAGVAGLIKAALVLDKAHIPASLHQTSPTRHVSMSELNIEVPATGRAFPECAQRLAGVNSFGFGGTNAHVVLAQPPVAARSATPLEEVLPSEPLPLAVLPISARSEDALVATAGRLAAHLSAHPDIGLPDLGYTLSRRRTHLNHRHTVIADSVAQARDQLQALADGGQVSTGRIESVAPRLAFVCTGMGPQWWKMCRGLLEVFPTFTDSILRTDRELSRYTDWSLMDQLRSDETHSRMADTEVAQPANFAIQVALAEQLAEFGIVADAVIGHSAGEVAAHHLAGLLTFEQAVHVIYHRSRLQQRTSGQGRMLAVGLDAESLMQMLEGATLDEFDRQVSVAAINSPSAVTVAGEASVLHEIARQCDEAGVFHRYLAVRVPYHTHYMEAIRDDLFRAFEGLSSKAAARPLYSTVTGERLEGYQAGAAYWWQNTRATVLFEPALRRMLDDGYTHFLELGPHPVLAGSIVETAGTQRVSTIATQRKEHDDARTLLSCVGALHEHGRDISWEALHPRGSSHLLKLPSYPWQTKRYWNETQEVTESLFYRPVHPLLGQPVSAVRPTWEAEISTVLNTFLADHEVQGSVVVPGAVYLEMALAAAKETYGSNHSVDNLVLHRAVILDDTCDPILRTTLNQDDGTLEFAAFTATADGDLKWSITATAELNTLPTSPRRAQAPAADEAVTSMDAGEFYSRTSALGFGYGDAFRSVQNVVAGEDWAQAQLGIPRPVAAELDQYRFHPALIDGAFQTLFGAPFLGQQASDEPFLPTRIRHYAVYGQPTEQMTVHVRVASAPREQVDRDITITDTCGNPLVVINGFSVQSLSTSSRMSAERIDKGLYTIDWHAADPDDTATAEPGFSVSTWLVLVDQSGVGAAVAENLRSLGHQVRTLGYESADELDHVVAGHLDTGDPDTAPTVTGIVDCWPLDTASDNDHQRGVFPILRIVKALAEHRAPAARLFVVTSNAQPAPGAELTGVDQAPLWGLGRVVGHQEFGDHWGGLIDIDRTEDPVHTAGRICAHLTGPVTEDQIALRGDTTFVPRMRLCTGLTRPFPTKLTADATYVVTGGAGALGRVVATYLAERGARHITLLGRSVLPPRQHWARLPETDPHHGTVAAIQAIERLGVEVSTAGVDVADAEQVVAWLDKHTREGGRPVRGIVHAAGTVADQLLVNMGEEDFTAVMRPKIGGTRVLHDAFSDHDLDFFVMFGSAGSTIAAPGQGNYAAANAFLDAFAHLRQSQGLPALTIGWGPWSVGMVEELKLEKIYAQRGIELISPAVGARVLDRLINQQVPTVVAITADWGRARQAGMGTRMPQMFSELAAAPTSSGGSDTGSSILDVLATTPEPERPAVVGECVLGLVAAVFDCAVSDIEPDDMLDDIGLDSMMAMDFRVRVNTMFSIDLPVLEILRGVSVNSLSDRIMLELHTIHGEVPAATDPAVPYSEDGAEDEVDPGAGADDDVDRLIETLTDAELRQLLADLEAPAAEPDIGGTPS